MVAEASVKALLAAGADPSIHGASCQTPLYLSFTRRDLAGMDLLLAAGARVDIQDDYGRTPLSQAWVSGSLHRVIRCASPAVVFATLASSDLSRTWLLTFVKFCGFPSEAQWALMPVQPFPFLAALLPDASPADAREIVRRLPPAHIQSLRTSLLCLNRFLPTAIGSHIACMFASCVDML